MWYHEALFYHIYPLGLFNCPKRNNYKLEEHRILNVIPWINHIKELGFNALYIGPLFESYGHGYETTDYKKLDSRLGYNNDLKKIIDYAHKNNIRVILDGVFNHVGRDFFAFKDLKENKWNSTYLNWFSNVNFNNNNEYNDGFSYDNWGGFNLLVKLNHENIDVRNYILDVVSFWINEFDIDGIRLDAADVLNFKLMTDLRKLVDNLKPDFYLMGEVIHGDYTRWVNDKMLHSVTNYSLHKALYSGMNDNNFFEIAHTIRRNNDMKLSYLYNFLDNHDVERIYSKLNNKNYFIPVNIMLYTLPGIPSIYYGSEFAIEGKKEKGSDYSLRPSLNLGDFKNNEYNDFFKRLGKLKNESFVLSYGSYNELLLQNKIFVYDRILDNNQIIVAISNDSKDNEIIINNPIHDKYIGILYGNELIKEDNKIKINIKASSGDIYVAFGFDKVKPINIMKKDEIKEERKIVDVPNKPYESMSILELQQAILNKMAKNGNVTDYMKKTVYDNNHKQSLINWVKSFKE